MKIGVVGANSFLGYNLSLRLIHLGFEPILYFHKNKDLCAQLPNLRAIETIYSESHFDCIFLVSAVIPYSNSTIDNTALWKGNIELPYNLVNHFKDSSFIYSSSVSVYGDNDSIINENSPLKPLNLYADTKLAGETLVKFAKKYQIIRFSSIYGIQQYQKTFLPIAFQNALTNKEIKIFGNGQRKQNYIHVKDAVAYMIKAMDLDSSNTLLGVDIISFSNREVAEIIQKHSACQITFDGIDSSPSFEYNNELSRNILDWKPETSLETGISEIITSHKL
ncbi:MAG: NAD(P)-dependent oxidoreductase [Bacteroidetes bacterium]|nr:NAD(P)-dependent oxidoreductase [Bacteroidota bacterium]